MSELNNPELQALFKFINKRNENNFNYFDVEFGITLTGYFSFEIIGEKEMYWMGEPYPTLSVKLLFKDLNQNSNIFFKGQDKKVNEYLNSIYPLKNYISEFIKYNIRKYGIDYNIHIDYITNMDNKEKINEGKRYDNIIRVIVRDITDIIKLQEEGVFSLPEDIIDSEMTYRFTNFNTEFNVDVTIIHDDIEDFIIDGGYYSGEDNFEFEITYNPKKYPSFMYELIGELNEVVAHEFNHMLQDIEGELSEPGGEMDSLDYYLQPDELESQYKGFKRRSRITKIPIEVLVRNWFEKYGEMRGLSPEDIELIIHEILNYQNN